MQRRAWVAILTAAVVVVVGVGTYWAYAATRAPASQQVELVIQRDASGSFAFSPTSIHAAAGSDLEVTVVNYDPTNHSAPWRYCNVSGTMDGMMDGYGGWMGGGMMGGHHMHGLNPSGVSHTFTMVGSGYNVNVPIPPARAANDPSVVTFWVHLGPAGVVGWTCEADGMLMAGVPGGMPMGMLHID